MVQFLKNVKHQDGFVLQIFAPNVDKLVKLVPQLVAYAMEQLDVDINSGYHFTGKVKAGMGVSQGAIFHPAWATSDGYHMVGGGGTISVAGVNFVIGAKSQGKKLKVVMSTELSGAIVSVEARGSKR